MPTTVDAVYENGVIKLKEPMDLEDSTPVEVIVIAKPAKRPTRTPAEILAEIAALPMKPGGREFSGVDHDRILYGSDEGSQ